MENTIDYTKIELSIIESLLENHDNLSLETTLSLLKLKNDLENT